MILPDLVTNQKRFARLTMTDDIHVAIPIENDGCLDQNLVLIIGRMAWAHWRRFNK